jgi:glutamine amidotransferase-like uncharacterized protein
LESTVPGPTVLVVANERGAGAAGELAAEAIAGWTIARGRLFVVENGRGEESEAELLELTRELAPDYLVELCDASASVDRANARSSIVTDATAGSLARAAALVATLETSLADERLQYVVKESALADGLARLAFEGLGVPSVAFSARKRDQSETLRAREQRIVVGAFLTGLGMLEHGPDVLVGSAAGPDDVKVALYVAAGVAGAGPERLEALLEAEGGFVVRRVCASDVRAGVLTQFDVVVFPGGSATSQAGALGAEGRAAVRTFVADGGGYLGICAGAYLASNEYEWALGVLDALVVDREHWARGSGAVRLELSSLGEALCAPIAKLFDVHYENGPVFERGRDDALPNFRVLAWYRGEVAKDGVPSGVMADTPALVLGRFGAGRVVCSSPHPEQTPGLEPLVVALVRSAAGK